MNTKTILIATLAVVLGGGAMLVVPRHLWVQTNNVSSASSKILYYTCPMHPSVKSDKPGNCPECGMKLQPVYADMVTNRPVRRTVHLSGEISWNSWTAAWFEFTACERDLQWFKIGQTFNVIVSSAPDKIYHAQIKLHGTKPFADANFDMMSGSTTVRAEILNPPIEAGDFGQHKLFNGLHAEAHVVAETELRETFVDGNDRAGRSVDFHRAGCGKILAGKNDRIAAARRGRAG